MLILTNRAALAVATLFLRSALATVPESLSQGFKTELQVSYTGDSSDGFSDGDQIAFSDAAELPKFALGDSSGVNTAATYMIMMLDTTDENSLVMHFMKPDYKPTGEKTALASSADPLVAYSAPGSFGEQGERQYSFLLYMQKTDEIVPTSKAGEKFNYDVFMDANDIEPAVAGVEMMVGIGDENTNVGGGKAKGGEGKAKGGEAKPQGEYPTGQGEYGGGKADYSGESGAGYMTGGQDGKYGGGMYEGGSKGGMYEGGMYDGEGGSGSDMAYGEEGMQGWEGAEGSEGMVMDPSMYGMEGEVEWLYGGWVSEMPWPAEVADEMEAIMAEIDGEGGAEEVSDEEGSEGGAEEVSGEEGSDDEDSDEGEEDDGGSLGDAF